MIHIKLNNGFIYNYNSCELDIFIKEKMDSAKWIIDFIEGNIVDVWVSNNNNGGKKRHCLKKFKTMFKKLLSIKKNLLRKEIVESIENKNFFNLGYLKDKYSVNLINQVLKKYPIKTIDDNNKFVGFF